MRIQLTPCPSPLRPRSCMRFQFNSFQWQCDAMRFDSILFWLSLSAWLPVFPVCFSGGACRTCWFAYQHLSLSLMRLLLPHSWQRNQCLSTALHQSSRSDSIYIYLHFSPTLPPLSATLSLSLLICQIDLYLLVEANEDKCLRISLWAVLSSRLIDMWVEPRGKFEFRLIERTWKENCGCLAFFWTCLHKSEGWKPMPLKRAW